MRLKDLRHLKHWQVIAIMLFIYDLIAVNVAYGAALMLRFDLHYDMIPDVFRTTYLHFVPIYTLSCAIVFYIFRMYRSMWRFVSYQELVRTIKVTIITFCVQVLGIHLLMILEHADYHRMPVSYYLIGVSLQFCLTLGIRFSYRFVNLIRSRQAVSNRVPCMIYGAGAAGTALLKDVMNGASDQENEICCLLDDNSNKWGRTIDNIPIVGGRDSIFEAVEKYKIKKIFFAIPTATAEEKRDILQICNETGCEVKQLPGLYQFTTGNIKVTSMKDVKIEDLLGRDTITADMSGVYDFIRGKKILVTGGGGSIGSELCRQVAAQNPKQLIIFDVYENNAYSIQLELKKKYPELDLVTLMGSVRDSRRINQVFETYKPDVVYHAAAHKHVPLMEDSPCEAIKNNVIGTYKTAYAAMKNGTKRFVLISTDKAVNPTNIMGASKRLCEMVIQTFEYMSQNSKEDLLPPLYTHYEDDVRPSDAPIGRSHTQFVAVRFGNVLGSNGSVIPIFKQQIENGGPVTVTHPDIIRYFMTIPEAVSLVMLAGTYAKGGEIFVLDMGSPVKIDTLARNLIRLSGYKPDVDIKVEYTGLRPGEKLFEERLMAEEGLEMTPNKLIFIGKPIPFDNLEFLRQLEVLEQEAYDNNEKDIRELVKQVVTTYHEA